MKYFKNIILVFSYWVLISTTTLYAQNNLFFEQGNALYNEGKYAEAIEKYQKILDSDEHSAELYFNMGNAHYKLNNVAPSIYYFEKALLLKPNDEDIKNNLTYAQNMTVDAIEEQPEVGFAKYVKQFINYFSYDTWAKLTIVFLFLFILLFIVYYFSYNTTKKRIAFIGFVISLFITGLCLSLAFQKQSLDKKDRPAIVFVQEVGVKNGPNNESDELFTLHEGTKVQVLERFEEWNKIELKNGNQGWIPNNTIKMLNNK